MTVEFRAPVTIATDITVDLEDRPHALAAFVEIVAAAGIELEGFCGLYADGTGIDHVLTSDVALTRQALAAEGMRITSEREVLVIDIGGEAAEFAVVARRLADADIEVDLVYLATRGRLVLGVDDLMRAQSVLGGAD